MTKMSSKVVSRKRRDYADISSMEELREVRRWVDMKLWYTEEKLSDDVREGLSADNLMYIIAPPGSAAERVIDGVTTGLATVRGVINAIGVIRERHR